MILLIECDGFLNPAGNGRCLRAVSRNNVVEKRTIDWELIVGNENNTI